jgi:hypothetical protein
MKIGPVFCEKGIQTDVWLYSTMTPGKKMKEVIVYGPVLDKKLLRFLQIRLPLAITTPARSGL